MKKIIAFVLALVMVLSLTAVAFAFQFPDFPENKAVTENRTYTQKTNDSLARVIVNAVAHFLGDTKDHYIGFYGLDTHGIVARHDDTVNDIADCIHNTITSVAIHMVKNCGANEGAKALAKDIFRAANKLSDSFAFFFSVNGRGTVNKD